MPALGGSGILPPLGLAPAAVAAQSLVAVGVARGVWFPPSGAGSARLASSLSVGVCCGCFLCAVFPVFGGFPWRCRGSSGRALVAATGGFGVVGGRSALAGSGVGAVVLRCRGRGRLPVGLGGGGVRGGLVGLGRVSAGGSPVRRSGLGCLRSGGRPAVSPVVAARCASRSRGLGAGHLVAAGFVAPALPALVAPDAIKTPAKAGFKMRH